MITTTTETDNWKLRRKVKGRQEVSRPYVISKFRPLSMSKHATNIFPYFGVTGKLQCLAVHTMGSGPSLRASNVPNLLSRALRSGATAFTTTTPPWLTLLRWSGGSAVNQVMTFLGAPRALYSYCDVQEGSYVTVARVTKTALTVFLGKVDAEALPVCQH